MSRFPRLSDSGRGAVRTPRPTTSSVSGPPGSHCAVAERLRPGHRAFRAGDPALRDGPEAFRDGALCFRASVLRRDGGVPASRASAPRSRAGALSFRAGAGRIRAAPERFRAGVPRRDSGVLLRFSPTKTVVFDGFQPWRAVFNHQDTKAPRGDERSFFRWCLGALVVLSTFVSGISPLTPARLAPMQWDYGAIDPNH